MNEHLSQDRPRAYRPRAFEKAFGVGHSTTYKWIAEGKLKTVKVNGARLILADSAEALLQGEAA